MFNRFFKKKCYIIINNVDITLRGLGWVVENALPTSMMGHGLDFYHGTGSQPCICMMYMNGCVDEFISFYFFYAKTLKEKQNTILMPEDY